MESLLEAISKAQAEMTNPPKNKVARVRMKTGGEYSYKYTDLSDIIDHLRAVLAKNGLSVIQYPSFLDDKFGLFTLLGHKSGQTLKSFYPLDHAVTPQELGSQITYARRYSLCAMLNISGDADDDAQIAQESKKEVKVEPPKTFKYEVITDPQRKRLHAIAISRGLKHEELKRFLAEKFRIDSTANIQWNIYDKIIKELELLPEVVK